MSLHSCQPSLRDRRRRLRRLGMTRRLAPMMVAAGGRRWLQAWANRALLSRPSNAEGFHLPLPLVEAAWGSLPQRSCPVGSIDTILADWVACRGKVVNTTDYFLGAGDWSPLVRSTDGDPVREEARQLQAAGFDFASIPAYLALVRDVECHRAPRRQGRRLQTRADVDAYFERFVRLFRSIQTHGALSRHELDARQLRFNDDRGLGIAMDADGAVHRLQGANHRWAIAQVLEIAEVPVELRLVHVEVATPALVRELSGA